MGFRGFKIQMSKSKFQMKFKWQMTNGYELVGCIGLIGFIG
jgi:hypothetical protein